MKPSVIVLGIVCVVLVGMLYLNHNSAQKQEAETAQQLESLTNQIRKAETESFKTIGDLHYTNSLQASNLEVCVRQLATASNRLSHTVSQLASTRKTLADTHGEVATLNGQLEGLRNEANAVNHQLETLKPVRQELKETKQDLLATQRRLSRVLEELGGLRVEYHDLSNKLNDVEFLKLQTVKAKELEKLRSQAVKAKPDEKLDPHAPLVLLPDGTVRLASQAETTPTVAAPR